MLAIINEEFQQFKQCMDFLDEFYCMTYDRKIEVLCMLYNLDLETFNNEENDEENDEENNKEDQQYQELFEKYINYD